VLSTNQPGMPFPKSTEYSRKTGIVASSSLKGWDLVTMSRVSLSLDSRRAQLRGAAVAAFQPHRAAEQPRRGAERPARRSDDHMIVPRHDVDIGRRVDVDLVVRIDAGGLDGGYRRVLARDDIGPTAGQYAGVTSGQDAG